MQLTILMPCLNEAETLALCINKANDWALHSEIQTEVLIADNGSTDGSQAIAESLGASVIPVAQRGYGSALFHGCMAARGEGIIMGDSDDSYDFSNLEQKNFLPIDIVDLMLRIFDDAFLADGYFLCSK